jgi:hypothetical protein
LYGAKTWTLRQVDQKLLESFEIRFWQSIEKISGTDRVRNEVLYRVKERSNILRTIKRRKATWIGHIMRITCVLKGITEGKVEEEIELRENK